MANDAATIVVFEDRARLLGNAKTGQVDDVFKWAGTFRVNSISAVTP
jgi:hypothetical protein